MEKSAVFISQPDWMVKEALSPLAAKALRYGGQGFQWLARHTPKLLKGRASVPVRNAGGKWSKGMGELLGNAGRYGGKHVKNPKVHGFFDDLAELGGHASSFGKRQIAQADKLWAPSNYKGFRRLNPLNYANSLARNAAGAGLMFSPAAPLYYGPGFYSNRKGIATGLGLSALGPLGNALDTSYRHTPIQRDPGMFGRGLRTQDVLRGGRRAVR